MYSLANLTELLYQHNQTTNSSQSLSTAEQSKLLDFGRRASRVIEGRTGSLFVPELWTWQYPAAYIRDHINRLYNSLRLPRPLVALTEITVSSTTLDSADYRLFPTSQFPVYELQWARAGTWSVGGLSDLYSVTGIWVNRSRYDTDAWISSGDEVENNPLTPTATSITVNDADGADGDTLTPRFSGGQVIRIEDEYCIVTAVDTTANTLTVKRGALGTTAASHAQNTVIDVFKVEPEIVRATMLTATFNYANVGQYKRVEFNTVTGANEERMEIPDEAVEIITRYRRKYVKGF